MFSMLNLHMQIAVLTVDPVNKLIPCNKRPNTIKVVPTNFLAWRLSVHAISHLNPTNFERIGAVYEQAPLETRHEPVLSPIPIVSWHNYKNDVAKQKNDVLVKSHKIGSARAAGNRWCMG